MSKAQTIVRLFREDPHSIWDAVFSYCRKQNLLNWLSDEKYLRLYFWCVFNKKLDLNNPKTFNEKLQWLKLYDRRPEYHLMVDKCKVKKYVADIIGEEHIVPTYGLWNSVDEIEWNKLTDKFVIKTTGGSGGHDVIICKDAKTFNRDAAIKQLNRCLTKPDSFWYGREWPYLGNRNRIIAEAYLGDSITNGLCDYKFHCFNGEPRLILVCKDRYESTGLTEDFFSEKWEHLALKRPMHNNASTRIKAPANLEIMLELSRKLSIGIPFVRVDFYEVSGKVFFGELTFFPASGFKSFEPNLWDDIMGSWLLLPNKVIR